MDNKSYSDIFMDTLAFIVALPFRFMAFLFKLALMPRVLLTWKAYKLAFNKRNKR
jgi:hypothetical protein